MSRVQAGTGAYVARILMIDDTTGFRASPRIAITPPNRAIMAPPEFTTACNITLPIISNRKHRENQQPFYRNLKKYRKP